MGHLQTTTYPSTVLPVPSNLLPAHISLGRGEPHGLREPSPFSGENASGPSHVRVSCRWPQPLCQVRPRVPPKNANAICLCGKLVNVLMQSEAPTKWTVMEERRCSRWIALVNPRHAGSDVIDNIFAPSYLAAFFGAIWQCSLTEAFWWGFSHKGKRVRRHSQFLWVSKRTYHMKQSFNFYFTYLYIKLSRNRVDPTEC